MDALLSLEEAARCLGIPTETLRYYRMRGCGPIAIKIGRHVKYRAADLAVWVDSHAETSR